MLSLFALSPESSGGLNPFDPASIGGLLWTWIIFLAALPFMWSVVMKKVAKALAERDGRVTLAIASAEEASREAQAAKLAVEARLSEAQVEATRLVEAARTRAEVREKELLDKAKDESEALLERARAEIKSAEDKAVANIRREVVDLTLKAAGQVLKRKVDAQDDRRLVEELMATTVRDGRS